MTVAAVKLSTVSQKTRGNLNLESWQRLESKTEVKTRRETLKKNKSHRVTRVTV